MNTATKAKPDGLRFFEIFREAVFTCIGPLPLDTDSQVLKYWFIRVSSNFSWSGIPDERFILGVWETLESTSEGQSFPIFNRIMTITKFKAIGEGLDLPHCYKHIAQTLLNLYPSTTDDMTLVRYDIALENHITDEKLTDIIAQNEWLPYLMAFSLLSMEDIDAVVKGEYKELLYETSNQASNTRGYRPATGYTSGDSI